MHIKTYVSKNGNQNLSPQHTNQFFHWRRPFLRIEWKNDTTSTARKQAVETVFLARNADYLLHSTASPVPRKIATS